MFNKTVPITTKTYKLVRNLFESKVLGNGREYLEGNTSLQEDKLHCGHRGNEGENLQIRTKGGRKFGES
jgi:hypothetical protein